MIQIVLRPAMAAIMLVTIFGVNAGSIMPRLSKDDPPAVIVYDTPGHRGPETGREFEFYQVRLAAWEDGRVVWSSRLPLAGYPYYEGKIGTDRVAAVVKRADGVTSESRGHTYLILDADSRTIGVRETSATAELSMSSSHPGFAGNPYLKIRSTGISYGEAGETTEPLTEKERIHQEFMREFDGMEKAAMELVPEDNGTSRTAQKLKFNIPRLLK